MCLYACVYLCEKFGKRGRLREEEVERVCSILPCIATSSYSTVSNKCSSYLSYIDQKIFSLPFLIIFHKFELQNESGQGDEEREAVMNIDTAISSDHARIEMDPSTGLKPVLHFYLFNNFVYVNR